MQRNLIVGDVFTAGVDDTIIRRYTHYVVTRTAMTGGGTGHGPGDVYPDGHRVVAIPIDSQDDENELGRCEFYQSGSFTELITPNQLIWLGSAKALWTRIL